MQPAREALVAQFSGLLEQDRLEAADDGAPYVPPHRLRNLLHMAVAYQVRDRCLDGQCCGVLTRET